MKEDFVCADKQVRKFHHCREVDCRNLKPLIISTLKKKGEKDKAAVVIGLLSLLFYWSGPQAQRVLPLTLG